ncbi:MAG: 2Fe-2S iron-sulfur cluster-binding protein [Flavobacteriales bacterium]
MWTTCPSKEMMEMPEGLSQPYRLRIIYQGMVEEVEGDADEPLLGSVLDHGISVPFGCQSGTCLACNAVLLEGEVEMKDSPALSQRSKEKGVILTCTAYPRSGNLLLSYDD